MRKEMLTEQDALQEEREELHELFTEGPDKELFKIPTGHGLRPSKEETKP
jgi:hypothetical protein